MDFKVFNSIYKLTAIWNGFDALASQYRSEDKLRYIDYSFYQTYLWNEFAERYMYSKFNQFVKRKYYEYVVIYDGDNAVAILPLIISKKKLMIEFSSWRVAGINNIVFKPGIDNKREISNACIIFLEENYKGYRYIFNDIPESSPFFESLAQFSNHVSRVRCSYNLYLSAFSDFDSYKKTLSKSLRQTLRTARNHLSRTDNWRFVIYDDTSQIKTSLVYKLWKLYYVRRNEWKNRSKFKSNSLFIMFRALEAFFTDPFSQILSKSDNVRLCALEIEGIPVAFAIYFLYENNMIIPRLAIDSRYSKFAPGFVMLEEMIRWAIDSGIENFELGRGDEAYKTRIGSEGSKIGQFVGSFSNMSEK